eukprot:692073-Rhodomonas_salina.1
MLLRGGTVVHTYRDSLWEFGSQIAPPGTNLPYLLRAHPTTCGVSCYAHTISPTPTPYLLWCILLCTRPISYGVYHGTHPYENSGTDLAYAATRISLLPPP